MITVPGQLGFCFSKIVFHGGLEGVYDKRDENSEDGNWRDLCATADVSYRPGS
jgi:hypothetical protein